MKEPKISVVVPTYHRDDLLARCLDHLAPGVQTFPADQYEVIVTDDGSKSTAERMILERYPWAYWTAGPKNGRSANRNNGAMSARGDWVAFIDDDCIPSSEWLTAYASAIQSGIFVYEGNTVCTAGVPSPLYTAPVTDRGGWLWSCNMMVQKALFHTMGGFDEIYGQLYGMEDVDLRERLKKFGYHFPFVAEAIVDHPPRRIAWGSRLGPSHENEILFWCREGEHRPVRLLYCNLIRSRLKTITQYRLSTDSFIAVASLVSELFFISKHVGSWEKKYRKQQSYE